MEPKTDLFMSHLKYSTLCLNGQTLKGSDLINFCDSKLKNPQTNAWEIPIFEFILEWLDKSESIIVKTSGSTGTPKQIRLKKVHMINSAKATTKALDLKEKQTALLALSADYIAGKMMIVRAMVCGLNLVVVEPSGNPLKNLDEIIDFTALVPLQLSNTLKSVSQTEKLRQIKNVLIGGGAIEEPLIQKISSFSNNFYGSYGMTETCTHIALKRLNGQFPDKYYQTLPKVKISADQRSCLVINADHLSDSKLLTNDLVTIFSETEFVINGRYDHIINSGGIKVSPEAIENKLKNFIKNNFMVSSVPDDLLGEKIILVIESDQSNLNELYKLWSKTDAVLKPYEIPKLIEFYQPFIFTLSGKIDRNALREKIREKLRNK